MKVQLESGVILEPTSDEVAEQMIESGYATEVKEKSSKKKDE